MIHVLEIAVTNLPTAAIHTMHKTQYEKEAKAIAVIHICTKHSMKKNAKAHTAETRYVFVQ
jgi:hypothetical protein